MDEFGLIKRFFSSLSIKRSDVLLGIGDDAALLIPPKGMALAVSTDSLVCGQHFLKEWDPSIIGYKALACNLSDMAAMGAVPAWVSLALTLPDIDEAWLKGFSTGFDTLLKRYSLALIGGDVTKGPLQITVTIQGFVKPQKTLRRDGAKVGDLIYVTGQLGEPAYALTQMGRLDYSSAAFQKLFYPSPRIEHGLILADFANSAIDISDGLAADLTHILNQSQKGAALSLEKIPRALTDKVDKEAAYRYALTGGDEYELCFTVSPSKAEKMEAKLTQAALDYHQIGVVTPERSFIVEKEDGTQFELGSQLGFQHF
jgi:thiamine-monophosphate kinase